MAPEKELAWAAGFFDGEGSTSMIVVKPERGKTEGYKHPIMRISQVGRETLERFEAAVGVGHITGPYDTKAQPQYVWQAGSVDPSWMAAQVLWPYLSRPKREQFARIWERVFS
jgi:hypothetical protein